MAFSKGIFIERPSRMAEVILKTPPLTERTQKSYQEWREREKQLYYLEQEEKEFYIRNELLNEEIDRKIEWINKRRYERVQSKD